LELTPVDCRLTDEQRYLLIAQFANTNRLFRFLDKKKVTRLLPNLEMSRIDAYIMSQGK